MIVDALMAASLLAVWTWLRLPRSNYQDYLNSLGWAFTKALRKRETCQRCGTTKRLQLHHESYRWHNRHPNLRYFVPNLWDPMKTLCDYHHGRAHGKG